MAAPVGPGKSVAGNLGTEDMRNADGTGDASNRGTGGAKTTRGQEGKRPTREAAAPPNSPRPSGPGDASVMGPDGKTQ